MPGREGLTPGQQAKQRQVLRAGMRVLLSQGVAGCTAREVEAAGPLTKSAIHYYFADMDVLVDRAMAEHVAVFVARMHSAAAAAGDPQSRFWAAVDAYLAGFGASPSVTRLWFEYWIHASRRGQFEVINDMQTGITKVITALLAAAGVPAAAEVGSAVFSYLMGAVITQSGSPREADALKADIAALAGLPLPVEPG